MVNVHRLLVAIQFVRPLMRKFVAESELSICRIRSLIQELDLTGLLK